MSRIFCFEFLEERDDYHYNSNKERYMLRRKHIDIDSIIALELRESQISHGPHVLEITCRLLDKSLAFAGYLEDFRKPKVDGEYQATLFKQSYDRLFEEWSNHLNQIK